MAIAQKLQILLEASIPMLSTLAETSALASSLEPTTKKQRASKHMNDIDIDENDMIDLLRDIDNMPVGDSGSNTIARKDKSQTTFSGDGSTKSLNRKKKKQQKQKNKKKRTFDEQKQKHEQTTSSRVFFIKAILVDIVKYLEIKQIILIRQINQVFNNLLYFQFICEDFNVYFEYSNKLLVREIVQHQISSNIENIALWYFASLNRTVGYPIFEREKAKEKECNAQFDAFMKYNGDNLRKSFVCRMKCVEEEEICRLDFILSELPQELSMNEISGECAVLPFRQLYQQLTNLENAIIDNEICPNYDHERHVFGDIVSTFVSSLICFIWFLFIVVDCPLCLCILPVCVLVIVIQVFCLNFKLTNKENLLLSMLIRHRLWLFLSFTSTSTNCAICFMCC